MNAQRSPVRDSPSTIPVSPPSSSASTISDGSPEPVPITQLSDKHLITHLQNLQLLEITRDKITQIKAAIAELKFRLANMHAALHKSTRSHTKQRKGQFQDHIKSSLELVHADEQVLELAWILMQMSNSKEDFRISRI